MSNPHQSQTRADPPPIQQPRGLVPGQRRLAADLLPPTTFHDEGRGILVIEDSKAYALRTRLMLEEIGYARDEIQLAQDMAAARSVLATQRFAAIFCDLDLPDSQGLETVGLVLGQCGPAAVIVLSSIGNQDMAMEAVAIGAQDFVVKGRDEVLALKHVLAYALERRRILNHLEETLEQNRRDLQAAADVQRSLFPEVLPQLPGFTCAWRHLPSQLVSGDICNVVPLDDRHFAWYLLDVMGHGVAAALLACQVSRLLMAKPGSLLLQGEAPRDPALLLADLNRRFQMGSNGGRFFTMVYAVVDGTTGRARVGNAGHPVAYLRRSADGRLESIKPAGLPIGVADNAGYEVQEIDLSAGDRVFCCSDGFHEARDREGDFFGNERLCELLSDGGALDLDQHLDRLLACSRAWTAEDSEQDDRTIIGIERT